MNLTANGSPLPQLVAKATGPQETDGDVFPLSFMQESLWLVEQMAPGTAAYNLVEAWRLKGPLDVAVLRTSLQAIAQRHEPLRTRLVRRGHRPAQQVLSRTELELPLVDLSGAADKQEPLRLHLQSEARRLFQFDAGVLARFRLYRLAECEHTLLLSLHHIISDGWSFQVLLKELFEAYSATLECRPVHLPYLPIQYADWAVWQREMAQTDAFQVQLDYWQRKLAGPLPETALPADHKRPGTQSFRGQTQFFAVPKPTVQALKELSRGQGATLFMTLLAAFKVLLARLTRQTDILVGSPMAGRERVETENLLGLFVNTHALRTDLGGDPSFVELLRRVRETVLAATDNQEVPVEKVIERLNPSRALNRHPLFQVVFGLLNGGAERTRFGGLDAERMDLDNGGAKFDWSLLLTETEQGLLARSEYSTDLFEAGTVERWGHYYRTLLADIPAHPEVPISRIRIMSDSERAGLLARGNPAPVQSRPVWCVHRWFEEQVRKAPDATAVSCEGQRLSYGELNRQANQLARHLQRCGVGAEVPVALCLERSLELLVAVLGVLKAGGFYLPMDPAYPKERLRFMVEDARVPVLLTQASLRERLPQTAARVIYLDAECGKIAREPAEDLDTVVGPQNAAYVIYTSGSTGAPKGVVVSHYNVVRLFEQTAPWFQFNSTDVWSLFHSYTFDFSVWEIWGALLYGGRLVIVPFLVSRAPDEFCQLLANEQVTVLNQTPSAFRQLLWAEASSRRPRELRLRYVIFGGEALELQSLKPWFERHGDRQPRLVNMYGITETTVHVTYRVIRQADLQCGIGSVIGEPIPDLRLYLLDPALQLVPPGVAGEVCVGGAGVARGYLNRPELTEQRFVSDPLASEPGARLYRSGDLARFTAGGELEYLGRMDDQVKIRGFRVELREIESALNQHAAVRESIVLAQPDSSGGHRLVGYIVARNQSPAPEALRLHLRQRLPEYMVPQVLVPVEKIPLTSNGKVDRRALPSPEGSSNQIFPVAALPQSPMEKLVARTWCEVLGRERVAVDENFFISGGHSLLATQVMARLGAALNEELSVRLLFEAPTVATLAKTIEDAQRQSPGQPAIIPRRAETCAATEWFSGLGQLTEEELEQLLQQTQDPTFSA
jgi:amino acid adenylation domain-containing protein